MSSTTTQTFQKSLAFILTSKTGVIFLTSSGFMASVKASKAKNNKIGGKDPEI